jgi:enoyl-CoA hydratase/carnithine racemase
LIGDEDAMTSEVLLDKREDRIAILTLNRPHALNAIDRAMVRLLRDAIRDVESDDAIDAVIVTGAGDKAFCVGVDLKERQTLSDEGAQTFRMGELFPMYRELEQKTKPTIALVGGHCLGGGFEIALSCDMILAAPAATFGLPEVKWGLVPAAGGCRKLPKLIGIARAKELIFTGRSINAAEAERIGIINRVVAAEILLQQAIDLLHLVLANVQVAVRGAKRCLDQAWDSERTAAFDLEVANLCYAARERKEGVSRFVSGKSPRP